MRALVITLCLAAAPALAEYRGLVIGNESYRYGDDIPGAEEALNAVRALQDAGFVVQSGENRTAAEMRELLASLLAEGTPAEKIVILLSGHFAHSASDSWFLGSAATAPDLARVGNVGVSLTTILDIAAQSPGAAIVMLGSEDRDLELGTGLTAGLGALRVPQGVTVLRGEAGDLAEFASEELLRPGQNLAALVAGNKDVTAEGFLARSGAFLPVMVTTAPAPAVTAPPKIETDSAEEALWKTARTSGSLANYTAYLDRYPTGNYAKEARAAADALRDDPAFKAMKAEEALGLSKEQRQQIQRDLALLGHDPRGIDGIFGPGTRAAVASWQKSTGHAALGYIDSAQIVQLSKEAEQRAIVLEEEARRRQAELEREDQAFWDRNAGAGEGGLRAYLEKYPDGLHTEEAQAQLDAIETERQAVAAEKDRAAWAQAEAANSIEGYTAYLDQMPKGAFAETARARIEELRNAAGLNKELEAARAGEEALGLNGVTRQAVEARLQAIGLEPGPVDGKFDDNTRRAIRRYQQARDLPATGYLTEATVVRLLADALGGVLR